MIKIICKKVAYCLPSDIRYIFGTNIELAGGKSFRDILSDSDPVYQCTISNLTPGALVEETLSISLLEPGHELVKLPSTQAVLKLTTDSDDIIIMGNQLYPAVYSIHSSGKRITLDFTVQRPFTP